MGGGPWKRVHSEKKQILPFKIVKINCTWNKDQIGYLSWKWMWTVPKKMWILTLTVRWWPDNFPVNSGFNIRHIYPTWMKRRVQVEVKSIADIAILGFVSWPLLQKQAAFNPSVALTKVQLTFHAKRLGSRLVEIYCIFFPVVICLKE